MAAGDTELSRAVQPFAGPSRPSEIVVLLDTSGMV